jgi:arylsulfatase A-like enzyme
MARRERNRVLAHTMAGCAGGMLGMALVGLLEAGGVLLRAGSLADLGVLPFALITYGVCGALGGAGLGFAVGLVARAGSGTFPMYMAGFFFVAASVIGRFRVIRDVFDEQMPQGIIAILGQLVALLLLALVAVGIFRLARRLTARAPGAYLANPFGAIIALGGAVAVALVLSSLPGALRESPAVPAAGGPVGAPPMILIMVDTLRADRLGAYGAEDVQTPRIDGLASDGILFTRAFAQASWTRPSVATILTGLYPSSHGAVHKADVLSDSVETLAEGLQAHGYRTIGLANNANVTAAFNFQQGFDDYIYLAPDLYFGASESAAELIVYKQLRVVRERLSKSRWVRNYYQPAEEVTAQALEIVKRERGRPFFLYLHYMDPHDPYFSHPFDGHGVARVATPRPADERAKELLALYDGEVEYLDEQLGRLFEGLRELGVYDKALIVLTADHGEEFLEHGGWWHGTTLYDEQIAVPLIVKPPGPVAAGRVATGLARSLDIAPTLLAAAGAAAPEEMQGRVLAFIAPDRGSPEAVFSENELEGNVLRSVRTEVWKLIIANEGNPRGQPANQVFQIEADPGERDNVFGKGKPEERDLATALDTLAREAGEHARAVEQGDVDTATQERLKALGYVD